MTTNMKIGRQLCPGCAHYRKATCAHQGGVMLDLVPSCLERPAAPQSYVICEHCGQPMSPGSTCSEWIDCPVDEFDQYGTRWKSVRPYRRAAWDGDHNCHDCNCRPGGYHHAGCDLERCPVCGEQFLLHAHNPYGGTS